MEARNVVSTINGALNLQFSLDLDCDIISHTVDFCLNCRQATLYSIGVFWGRGYTFPWSPSEYFRSRSTYCGFVMLLKVRFCFLKCLFGDKVSNWIIFTKQLSNQTGFRSSTNQNCPSLCSLRPLSSIPSKVYGLFTTLKKNYIRNTVPNAINWAQINDWYELFESLFSGIQHNFKHIMLIVFLTKCRDGGDI